jgi:hypothetical protein
MNDVYSERAALVAFLAKIYPAWIAYNDKDEPDWAVVYLETPQGQLSWHIAEGDRHLFNGIVEVFDPPAWDGHATEEKYRRLAQLDPGSDLAAMA